MLHGCRPACIRATSNDGNLYVVNYGAKDKTLHNNLRHAPKKLGGGYYASFQRGAPCNSVAWAKAYLRTKCYPDPSSCVATVEMDHGLYAYVCKLRKWGGCCAPVCGGSWVFI